MTLTFFKLAIPAMTTCSLGTIILSINSVFAGRLNNAAKLAGVGLAASLSHIVIMAVLSGLNGALETLVSQAFGFGELRMCGILFNRGRIILTLAFIPLAIVLSFSEAILVSLKQDPEVSRHA